MAKKTVRISDRKTRRLCHRLFKSHKRLNKRIGRSDYYWESQRTMRKMLGF